MKTIYLAGPWFNPRQKEIIEAVIDILESSEISYYSPKDEILFDETKDMDPMDVFRQNLQAIHESKFIIAITDGKDMGTLFESGYAYAVGKPIVYLWIDKNKGDKFNLMLAASGRIVALNFTELSMILVHYKETEDLPIKNYRGKIE